MEEGGNKARKKRGEKDKMTNRNICNSIQRANQRQRTPSASLLRFFILDIWSFPPPTDELLNGATLRTDVTTWENNPIANAELIQPRMISHPLN